MEFSLVCLECRNCPLKDLIRENSSQPPSSFCELWVHQRKAHVTYCPHALAARAAAGVSLNDPGGVAVLFGRLAEVGAAAQVTELLARSPAVGVSHNDLSGVAALLDSLREAGAAAQVTALAAGFPAAGLFELHPDHGSCRSRAAGRHGLRIVAVVGVAEDATETVWWLLPIRAGVGEFAGQGKRRGVTMIVAASRREDLFSDLSPLVF